ncbi:hypothetical protein EV714DRAFT_271764 [Schizophyllum commune]
MSVTSPLRPAVTAPLVPYTGAERSYTRALKTRAFTEALDGRDVFLGQTRCVVCGAGQTEYCHILPDTDSTTWADAKAHGWIPAHAAELPEHPNNGLLLIGNSSSSTSPPPLTCNVAFNAKAIALDPDDRNAALPTLFLLHELRARAKYPFQSVDAEYPFQSVDAVLHLSVHAVLPPAGSSKDIEWQEWITSSGILRSGPPSSSILRSSASSPYFRLAAQGA